ncbi:GtrA family protein [Mycolicibacterium sp.]|uniref:GtrA family protein n=1 Tax=Mycolicibacterium sp. TaxID=2320850 RepID=UPI00355CA610
MSFADATIARLPRPVRPFAERHHELIKFAIVGATTFIIDSAIFYTLKLTILEPKPVTAKIIAGIVAVIASYILNREWSFRDRGGRERHHEALLFFGVSGVGVLLSMAPLWVSSYVLMLRVPMVSLTTENIADFISAYIIGNLLQMMFRFWAFRRFVFPDEFARNPDKALESTFTGGGLAEALEDHYELHQPVGAQDPNSVGAARPLPRGTTPLAEPDSVVTPLRRSRRRAARQLGNSSDPTVSKTS